MARLLTDEDVPPVLARALREVGHDVVTVAEAGLASLRTPDSVVLQFAMDNNRAIITRNRRDFRRFHRSQPGHHGLILLSQMPDALANRQLTDALSRFLDLEGRLISVRADRIVLEP